MLFKPTNAAKIFAGEKTQTRRLVKYGDHARSSPADPATILSVQRGSGRFIWEVGKDYAISLGRGKFQVGRIKITAIRRERVKDISEEDVRAEGFCNLKEFLVAFLKINPHADLWDEVWALTFECVTDKQTEDPQR